jgi:hypothetical protein
MYVNYNYQGQIKVIYLKSYLAKVSFDPVMVNNSTNINKTNNNLSPQIIEHHDIYGVGNSGPTLA